MKQIAVAKSRRALLLYGLVLPVLCGGCAVSSTQSSVFRDEVHAGVEEIYVHRTVRSQHHRGGTPACAVAPFKVMNEDIYDLWSVELNTADSRIVDSHVQQVGSFRACLGQLARGQPLPIYVDGTVAGISFKGAGECRAPNVQPPVRTVLALNCLVELSELPEQYTGGMAVSSSLAPVLGPDQPVDAHVRGYLSTSVLTLRFWRKPQ